MGWCSGGATTILYPGLSRGSILALEPRSKQAQIGSYLLVAKRRNILRQHAHIIRLRRATLATSKGQPLLHFLLEMSGCFCLALFPDKHQENPGMAYFSSCRAVPLPAAWTLTLSIPCQSGLCNSLLLAL